MTRLAPLILIAIPAAASWITYRTVLPSRAPPLQHRSVHPPAPQVLSYRPPGAAETTTIELATAGNPLRALAQLDPEQFAEHIDRGRTAYYQFCYACHGSNLAADGPFAGAMHPAPTSFLDPDVLPIVNEVYLFWRIATGVRGLPDDATPWDSTMPAYHPLLSEQQIWEIISFLYQFAGHEPRTVDDPPGSGVP